MIIEDFKYPCLGLGGLTNGVLVVGLGLGSGTPFGKDYRYIWIMTWKPKAIRLRYEEIHRGRTRRFQLQYKISTQASQT